MEGVESRSSQIPEERSLALDTDRELGCKERPDFPRAVSLAAQGCSGGQGKKERGGKRE